MKAARSAEKVRPRPERGPDLAASIAPRRGQAERADVPRLGAGDQPDRRRL